MGIIKFLIDDIKKDLRTVKAIFEGKAKLKVKPKELFKWDATFWKENWLMFLLIILAFLMGYILGGTIATNICNDYILNNLTTQPFDPDTLIIAVNNSFR